MKDPLYMEDRDYDRKLSDLVDRGREIVGERYRDDAEDLVNSLGDFVDGLRSDELGQQLAEDVTAAARGIFTDE